VEEDSSQKKIGLVASDALEARPVAADGRGRLTVVVVRGGQRSKKKEQGKKSHIKGVEDSHQRKERTLIKRVERPLCGQASRG